MMPIEGPLVWTHGGCRGSEHTCKPIQPVQTMLPAAEETMGGLPGTGARPRVFRLFMKRAHLRGVRFLSCLTLCERYMYV